jgi:LuxR family transcriptional regulator, maltose regulon positive regulatory protein
MQPVAMVHFSHKIIVPQRAPYLVRRPRLIAHLERVPHQRLTTLSAPAGYGKTSLLIDYASIAPLPICWYTLDRYDEDPWVFLGYLASAVEQVFPGAMRQTLTALAGRAGNTISTVVNTLEREIYAVGTDFALLIDDWHLVDHVADITELVARLLVHCPNCHLVLASRIYPGLPDIMLLAARRQMSGLNESHLRFTAEEVGEVLGAGYEVALPAPQIEVLAEQARGWITGVLLALNSTGGSGGIEVPDARAERQVYSFLSEQVFDGQPEHIRTFLLQSSLLEELSAARCDALFERHDSGIILQTILRQHLFISEIEPGTLRYHPLFHEFLQEHFRLVSPQAFRETALRVAQIYVGEGRWSRAFDICIVAGDYEAARRIALQSGNTLYAQGWLETLERWFNVLPFADLDTSLLCLKARVLLDRGHANEAQALAEVAEARMQPEDETTVLLLQAQIARIAGRYEQGAQIARQVLDLVPVGPQRTPALRTLAICSHRLGRSTHAIAALHEALDGERQRGDVHTIALLQQDLGVCYGEAGQLHRAVECYTHADGYWAVISNEAMRAVSLNCKGVLQQLMGLYAEAYATLSEALTYARKAATPGYEATVLVSLGDLHSDLQLWERARAMYDEARATGGNAFLMSYLDLATIRLSVAQRQYGMAARMLARLPDTVATQHPVMFRLLDGVSACGTGDYARAQSAVDESLALLRERAQPMDLARVYILRAQIVATVMPSETAALFDALDEAASIVDELGYDAFLIVATLPFANMLRRAQAMGWARAADWLRRHQDVQALAHSLSGDDALPLLVVRALGTDQITLDRRPIDLGWLKAREVFFYLLAHPDGVPADVLREAIWPDAGRDSSRNSLKTAIYQLRSLLPRDMIVSRSRQVYAIDRGVVHLDYDVERFTAILDAPDADWEAKLEAFDLYRGAYLSWSDNDWSAGLREALEQRFMAALLITAERVESAGAYHHALSLFRRLLALDSLNEAAHAGVMRCQIALGNRAAALSQYEALRRVLDEELGLEPDRASEVGQLYYRILTTS